MDNAKYDFLLVQDSFKVKDSKELNRYYRGKQWQLLWEGRRPSDRDERFRLYRKAN